MWPGSPRSGVFQPPQLLAGAEDPIRADLFRQYVQSRQIRYMVDRHQPRPPHPVDEEVARHREEMRGRSGWQADEPGLIDPHVDLLP